MILTASRKTAAAFPYCPVRSIDYEGCRLFMEPPETHGSLQPTDLSSRIHGLCAQGTASSVRWSNGLRRGCNNAPSAAERGSRIQVSLRTLRAGLRRALTTVHHPGPPIFVLAVCL